MGGGFDDAKEGIMTFSWLHHHVNGEVINNSDHMGSEVELVKRVSGAQLFLVDVEESVLMQCGEFSLRLLKQTHSPLAAVVASVGEVQWPIHFCSAGFGVWVVVPRQHSTGSTAAAGKRHGSILHIRNSSSRRYTSSRRLG